MRIPASLCAAALAAVASLAPSVRAQVQAFGGADPDRKGCSLFLADMSSGSFDLKGAVAINYSSPQWQAGYDQKLDSDEFKGTNQRLGKNWWTNLDTSVALEIGGTKVAPGSYYLALHVDGDGKFQLLLIDPLTALKQAWAPNQPATWKADMKAPLTLVRNALSETVQKMEISITADAQDPTKGKFAVRWGKHELSAPVRFQLAGAKSASAGKGR